MTYDAVLAEILKDLGNEYAQAYAEDLQKTDLAGNTMAERSGNSTDNFIQWVVDCTAGKN